MIPTIIIILIEETKKCFGLLSGRHIFFVGAATSLGGETGELASRDQSSNQFFFITFFKNVHQNQGDGTPAGLFDFSLLLDAGCDDLQLKMNHFQAGNGMYFYFIHSSIHPSSQSYPSWGHGGSRLSRLF